MEYAHPTGRPLFPHLLAGDEPVVHLAGDCEVGPFDHVGRVVLRDAVSSDQIPIRKKIRASLLVKGALRPFGEIFPVIVVN